MRNLSKNSKRIRLPLDGTTTYTGTAGTSVLTFEGVDTRGYQGAMLRVAFGAINAGAVTSIKAQQSDDDGVTDAYHDIAGTAQPVADIDDNKVFEIDIWRPGKRYLALVVGRGTQNAVVDYAEVILYHPQEAAVEQPGIIGGTKVFNTPAEGTA